MLQTARRHAPWILAWCVLTALGCIALARMELTRLREAFETDARIVHRLLSQRVVQHDAILSTLALLQREADPAAGGQPEQRLSSLYPQLLAVARRERDGAWPDTALAAAEDTSRKSRRAALAGLDLAAGRYWLVLAAEPASFALKVDVRTTVPWSEWPMPPDTSPVRVTLEQDGQTHVVQPGRIADGGWRFDFHKHLASESQAFDVVALRQVGWQELPWGRMAALALALAAAWAALLALQRQRAARRRAEELLRLGQVSRLNALGELAAGMAHELNQPLTAVLANTQAASRLLQDDPPELDTAREAMAQAAQQARRASEVVGRLRRAVDRQGAAGGAQALDLVALVRNALYLLEPECRRRSVTTELASPAALNVRADPVALEQIVHNLLMNALQALEQVPPQERRLTVSIEPVNAATLAAGRAGAEARLRVADSGPGIPPDVLPRIFEPFFTTREGGLGLGLSLCESLAGSMGGSLTAEANAPRGAAFTLRVPLDGGLSSTDVASEAAQ
jgi:signal transduction histidine kinase